MYLNFFSVDFSRISSNNYVFKRAEFPLMNVVIFFLRNSSLFIMKLKKDGIFYKMWRLKNIAQISIGETMCAFKKLSDFSIMRLLLWCRLSVRNCSRVNTLYWNKVKVCFWKITKFLQHKFIQFSKTMTATSFHCIEGVRAYVSWWKVGSYKQLLRNVMIQFCV